PKIFKEFNGLTLEQLQDQFCNLSSDSVLNYPWWPKYTSEVEDNDDVTARVKPFIKQLIKEGEDVLLVGHSHSKTACIRALLDLRLEQLEKLGPNSLNWNCSLTIIEIKSEANLIEFRNVDYFPEK